MTDIIMIRVTDGRNRDWNIALDNVALVEFPAPGPVTGSTVITQEKIHLKVGSVISVPSGTWAAALTALEAEYNMGSRRVKYHLYIKS